ncbi:P3 protein [Alteromonas macleodii str. 'Black Sea 11']|nr:P3 protein [Alteromonas macleodii str. 'Black Sea 11']NKX04901.1 bile acid:sodium symporter family protein [Alteromonadaceae bacterium A_SAG6]NKX34837.1 bile acid:sodium symporter family protein [Alteromonadaceae bacterium A_SAG3]NKX68852.1 bile acid:sodium symporter family protein [Alteromonadaceae bacterium A_SAG7]
MQASVLTEVLLPLALAFVMFGMGLTLTLSDFARLLKAPKAVLTGFIGQIILLPMMALGLCFVFDLPDYIAVGVMVLAACPGGTTSNLISHVAKANLALSVSLTAISTIACVFSTPFIIQFALDYFVKENTPDFSIIQTVIGLVGISIVPVIIGMTIRRFNSRFATKTESFFRQFSMYFMLLMIVGVLVSERNNLAASFERAFLVCLTLNLSSVLLGLGLAKLSNLAFKDSLTLAIEIGVQNAALAMLICITFLDAPDYAIAPGVYGVAMYIGPALLALWAKRKMRNEQPSVLLQKTESV